jgi:glycerol-3-phosphate dehydrogenase
MIRQASSTSTSLSTAARFGFQNGASMRRSIGTAASTRGQSGPNSRRNMYFGAAAAVLVAGGAFTLTSSSVFSEERSNYKPVAGDIRPHPLWSPPTRAQMIAALKESSGKSLRPLASRSNQDNSSLQKKATDSVSSTPSPAASEHSGGEAFGRDGDEDGQGFDLLIIGGGATGTGVAVDAATRGLSVAMVERDDFGAGTSSKSTKLIHGGVRYLQKAVFELDYDQYKMVREALHERKTFLHIAPYLSEHLPIMLPVYR